jgi:hypothetical protein
MTRGGRRRKGGEFAEGHTRKVGREASARDPRVIEYSCIQTKRVVGDEVWKVIKREEAR